MYPSGLLEDTESMGNVNIVRWVDDFVIGFPHGLEVQ